MIMQDLLERRGAWKEERDENTLEEDNRRWHHHPFDVTKWVTPANVLTNAAFYFAS
jgi:hypothetical protein